MGAREHPGHYSCWDPIGGTLRGTNALETQKPIQRILEGYTKITPEEPEVTNYNYGDINTKYIPCTPSNEYLKLGNTCCT